MVIGAGVVMVLYLLVNFVMVANLTPATLDTFLKGDSSKITFAHVITEDLLGPIGGKIMSGLVVLSLISGMSSMTMVGPRVYEAMARDGFLPKVFAGGEGRPPLLSVLLQGALAMVLVLTHSLGSLIENVGVILTLTSVLTVLALFKVRFFDRDRPEKPGVVSLVSALVYVVVSGWMLSSVLSKNPIDLLWSAVIALVSTTAYVATRVFARAR
jgi:APA family basic amino acid/polyamine antiporter